MRREGHFTDLDQRPWVERDHRPLRLGAAPYEDATEASVESDIVGVFNRKCRTFWFQRFGVVDMESPVIAAGDEDPFVPGYDGNALSLRNPRDGLDEFSLFEVNHFQRAFGEGREEQTVGCGVVRHMIETSRDAVPLNRTADAGERDRTGESGYDSRGRRLMCHRSAAAKYDRDADKRGKQPALIHAQLFHQDRIRTSVRCIPNYRFSMGT